MEPKTVDQWATLEQFGHRRTAGRLTEEERFGGIVGRLDVPQRDGSFVTKYFHASSIYDLTLVSEEAARNVALHANVHPVQSWEMPRPASVPMLPGPDVAEPTDVLTPFERRALDIRYEVGDRTPGDDEDDDFDTGGH